MFKYFNMDDKHFTLFSGMNTRESRFLRRVVLDIQPSLLELYSFDYIKSSVKSFANNISTRLFITAFQLCQWYKDGKVENLHNCRGTQIKSLFSRGPYHDRPHTGDLTLAQYFIMIFHVLGNDMWNKMVEKYEQYHAIAYKGPWLTKDRFVIDPSKPLPVPDEILRWIKEAYDIPLVMPEESEDEYESFESSASRDSVMEDVYVVSPARQEYALPFASDGADFQASFNQQQMPPMDIPHLPMNISIPAPTFPSMHASAQSTPHSEHYTNGRNLGSNMTPLQTPYNGVNLGTFEAMAAASNQNNRMDICQQQAIDTSATFTGSNMPMFTSPVIQHIGTSNTPNITTQPNTTAPLVTASSAQLNMLESLEDIESINVALQNLYQNTPPK
ncbi:hypothetical protein LPJ79_003456 [Coemansia sp. RSA 1821]|nr:hypothetical protein LPJ68_002763 [Coemansia sp. RSA 1086]KAJ1749775.1 hypothetical protein LPJ79_003456 [Coemansia sp. RSA 1821]